MWYKIILYLPFVVVKKVASFFMFPVAYLLRNKVYRNPKANKNIFDFSKNNGIKLFIWWFLDDSCYAECGKDYNTKGNKSWLVEHILPFDIFRSWYWGGFRNTSNNLSHYIAVGKFIKVIKSKQTKRLIYEVRQFEKGVYPYVEYHKFSLVYNCGWFHSGKFECKFRSNRRK